MVAVINARDIVLLILFVPLAFGGLHYIYLRRLVARIFAESSDESALEDVRAAIEEVNAECHTHNFYVSRLGTMVFRDHPILLVDGGRYLWSVKRPTNGAFLQSLAETSRTGYDASQTCLSQHSSVRFGQYFGSSFLP